MKKMKNTPGVIIIGDHVQSLNLIRSFGRRNIPTYLLHNKNICIARFSRYSKFIKIPSVNSDSLFLDFLIKLAGKKQVMNWILMPTNDKFVYFLSKHKRILEKYYKIPVPMLDTIKFAYNKKLTYLICKKNNIPTPTTFLPEGLEDLSSIIKDIKLPAIIKPAVSSHFYQKTKVKVFPVSSKDELLQKYKKASAIIDASEIMIQEVIPGGPEFVYNFSSFFKNKECIAYWTGRKIRQKPMKYGVSTFAESVWEPDLLKWGVRFLKAIDYYGISAIEFKKDFRDGEFKLIDVNLRTWNHHDLATQCGVDLPYLLYQDMVGKSLNYIQSFKENVKWMHICTDLGVGITEILKGNIKLMEYLSTLKGEKKFAVFSLDDPLPFFVEILILPYLWMTR